MLILWLLVVITMVTLGIGFGGGDVSDAFERHGMPMWQYLLFWLFVLSPVIPLMLWILARRALAEAPGPSSR
jgi:hypothetical protein